jgi:hypothetical protein
MRGGRVVILLFLLLAPAVRAEDAGLIAFTLPETQRVSLAVFDAHSGKLYRELLRGSRLAAGRHAIRWDGLDKHGVPVTATECEWRLVRSPGLVASFQFMLGKNPPHAPWGEWPGNHSSVSCVAVDETGIYLGANHAEAHTEIVKQSRDWTNQFWAIGQTYDGHHPLFLAAANGKLFALTAAGFLRRYNRDTGAIEGTWDFTWNGQKANHFSAYGKTLALAFKEQNAVRLVDAETLQVRETRSVPAPVAVVGDLLIVSGSQVVDGHGNVVLNGLTDPRSLATDGEVLYVAEGGTSQQLKKFARDGKPLAAFGRPGGRELGLYKPENFRDIADMAVDGRGNLIIAEPSAPRRTAILDGRDGHVVAEYYGGQAFYMDAIADPRDPTDVFFENYRGTYTHAKVDYDKRTWRVHAVYTHAPDMGGSPYNQFRIRYRDSQRCFMASAQPVLFRVDEAAGRWEPFVSVQPEGFLRPDRLTADYVTDGFSVLAKGSWEKPAFFRYNLVPPLDFTVGAAFPDNELPGTPDTRGLYEDAESNVYAFVAGRTMPGEERHGYYWPACELGTARLLKWSSDGALQFAVGRHAVVPGTRGEFCQPAGIMGETHDCLILRDRGGQPAGLVWTKDGLYVGTLMDRRAKDGLPDHLYRWDYWKDDSLVGELVTRANGDVYWFAAGPGDNPVFKISGWDRLVRESGRVTAPAGAAAARRTGMGWRATYYRDTAFGEAAFTRTDPMLRFGAVNDNDNGLGWPQWWTQPGGADLPASGFSVVWEGELEPTLTEPHVFSVYFSGIFKLWLGDELILSSSRQSKPWSRPYCGNLDGPAKTADSAPVMLTAGKRVPMRIEWRGLESVQTRDSGYRGPLFHLNWEARSFDRMAIPAVCVYPSERAGAEPAP